MHKAVFIDRDGVINKDLGKYVTHPDEFDFIPGVVEALKKLHKSEFKSIVVTNQGGIGRGAYTKQDVEDIHKKMCNLLKEESVKIDSIYYCPHYPDDTCECRKPKIGMVKQAVKEHLIDPEESFFIGDKTSDVKAGKDAGCKTFLVKTGYAGKDNRHDVEPDFVVSNLLEAVNMILKITT